MSRMILINAKIFGAIVQFIAVDMMRLFMVQKRAPEFLFQDDDMFKDVSLSICAAMIGAKNFLIALFHYERLSDIEARAFTRAELGRLPFGFIWCSAHQAWRLPWRGRMFAPKCIHVISAAEVSLPHRGGVLMEPKAAKDTCCIRRAVLSAACVGRLFSWRQGPALLPFLITSLATKKFPRSFLGLIGVNPEPLFAI